MHHSLKENTVMST